MARIVPLAFPVVEVTRSSSEERPEPLLPWSVRAIRIQAASPQLFPDANGPGVDAQHARHQRELEQRREQELVAQVDAALAEAREQGRSRGLEEGREQGYAEGLEQGRADARQEVEQLKASLRATLESLLGARETLFAAVETDLAEVALTLAAQLAAGAIAVEPSRIVELARQGMNLLADSDSMTIRAGATPAALLRTEQENLATALNISSLRIVEDPALEAEGCVVESELGRVDLRVSQRLQAARDLLNSVRNED